MSEASVDVTSQEEPAASLRSASPAADRRVNANGSVRVSPGPKAWPEGQDDAPAPAAPGQTPVRKATRAAARRRESLDELEADLRRRWNRIGAAGAGDPYLAVQRSRLRMEFSARVALEDGYENMQIVFGAPPLGQDPNAFARERQGAVEEAAEAMVKMAQRRGWQILEISGTPEVRKALKMAATRAGYEDEAIHILTSKPSPIRRDKRLGQRIHEALGADANEADANTGANAGSAGAAQTSGPGTGANGPGTGGVEITPDEASMPETRTSGKDPQNPSVNPSVTVMPDTGNNPGDQPSHDDAASKRQGSAGMASAGAAIAGDGGFRALETRGLPAHVGAAVVERCEAVAHDGTVKAAKRVAAERRMFVATVREEVGAVLTSTDPNRTLHARDSFSVIDARVRRFADAVTNYQAVVAPAHREPAREMVGTSAEEVAIRCHQAAVFSAALNTPQGQRAASLARHAARQQAESLAQAAGVPVRHEPAHAAKPVNGARSPTAPEGVKAASPPGRHADEIEPVTPAQELYEPDGNSFT